MRPVHLLPVGSIEAPVLEALRAGLEENCYRPCEILPARLDPEFAFHPERQQYHSSELLARLREYLTPESWRLLGVASVDLYIPILTFVFGEAQVGGVCAVISLHRLRQEFYGLPGDAVLLDQRLLKEAVHELGHTCRLTHCDEYTCAMAPSHGVEWIDLKGSQFCDDCEAQVRAVLAGR